MALRVGRRAASGRPVVKFRHANGSSIAHQLQGSRYVLARFQRSYWHCFLAALVICWSPFNALAYALPPAIVGWLIYRGRSRAVLRRSALAAFTFIAFLALHIVVEPRFYLPSGILSFLTFGSLLLLVAIPAKALSSPRLLTRVRTACLWTLGLQGVVGLVQGLTAALASGFDGDSGDAVEGTIHLALQPERTFSNPMFAVNVLALLIFLAPTLRGRSAPPWQVIVAAVALALASVMHVLIIGAGVIIGSSALMGFSLFDRRMRRVVLGVILLFLLVALAMPQNASLVERYAYGMAEGRYPRAEVTLRAWGPLRHDYPAVPLVGVGPGQFSSRAALMATGRYFGGTTNYQPLPLLGGGAADPFREFVADLWLRSGSIAYYGSTHQPFYSWLTFAVEFGFVAFVAVAVALVLLVRRLQAVRRTGIDPMIAWVPCVLALLIFFLGAQENYWEIPQGIVVPMLLYKLSAAAVWVSAEQHRDQYSNATRFYADP